MFLFRLPGVYAPQGDSLLLWDALVRAGVRPGARALDAFTGTGLSALAAARTGASRVLALDVSRRAVLTARANARLYGLPVEVRRTDFPRELPRGRFDLVTANPPYVPGPHTSSGSARAWDAGPDGRLHLDGVCRAAPHLLAEDGVLLLVHSSLAAPETTLDMLREAGLKASVVARRVQPFGPVLRSRAAWLERRGLTAPGQREEELVIVRADRTAR